MAEKVTKAKVAKEQFQFLNHTMQNVGSPIMGDDLICTDEELVEHGIITSVAYSYLLLG